MSDEYSSAVSFANSYFTLVDGLASGLEDYLAEDVILDWFGRTAKGKANVNTFMKVHKVNSSHAFNNIVPTESISYRKHNLNRKFAKQLNDSKQTKSSNSSSENVDNSLQATDAEGNHLKEEGVSYELKDSDPKGLSKLEITPTMAKEIECNIERMKKLKVEETVETMIKKEFGQDDGPEKKMQTKSIKFIEATGQIRLWKKRKGEEDVYSAFPASAHICKRSCKLQLAYSLIKSETSSRFTNINADHKLKSSISELQRRKLPSFEEISELSNRLIPNINNFGGYLRHVNFSEDRDNFLKSFGAEIARNESSFPRFAPQYVGNKLVFRKTNFTDSEQSKDFVFNYQIHMIIYEGDNRCKLNLSEKFAETK